MMTFVRKVLSTTMKVWVMAGTSSSSTTDNDSVVEESRQSSSLEVYIETSIMLQYNRRLFLKSLDSLSLILMGIMGISLGIMGISLGIIWGEILNRIIGRKSRIIWTGLRQPRRCNGYQECGCPSLPIKDKAPNDF